jgi:predicted Holliday junction resolvase-like endonuclease
LALMRRQRREIETASLSFLDVISCGFGALILLLVLTKVFEPIILEDTVENLQGYLASLQQELFEIRGESKALNREMVRKEDKQEEELKELAHVKADLSALQSKFDATIDKSKVDNVIQGRLAKARQSLTAEMEALLADYKKSVDENKIGGIPVDSEYVIFLIDTSGSMYNYAWPLVLRKVSETLDVYPKLKGIQVMNDMGNYMFSQYANDWIPDTVARRRAIIDRLRSWNVFSNSSPVEGITKAISTFYKPGRKISLYVFGDEFSGRSIQRVVDIVDRINRTDAEGKRMVRIHAVGFPVQFANPPRYQDTGIKFAILMRTLCERNGGTFVGLNDFRS